MIDVETLHEVGEVRALIFTGWTQYCSARDETGKPVNAHNPAATCWCLTGAITKVCKAGDVNRMARHHKLVALFLAVLNVRTYIDGSVMLARWNDVPHRTQQDVLHLTGKVIAALITEK